MATYKVLQDIEAEDKLLGPLSLKQFIFAAIFIGIGVLQFFIATSPAPVFLKVPFMSALVLPMLLFGVLAAPIGGDQPTEIWLIARINFLFKPRNRIWNQDGLSELVTITAPKREVHVYTDGLSQNEVRSRLQALANTVDSRGWAVKNVYTNMTTMPNYIAASTSSDRLIDPMVLPQEVPAVDITASDDMMDPLNNSTAQHLEQLIQESTANHLKQAISSMKKPEEPKPDQTNYWFMNQPDPVQQPAFPSNLSTFDGQQIVAPGTADIHPAAEETEAEKELAERILKNKNSAYRLYNEHLKTIQPLHDRMGREIPKEPEPEPEPQLNPVDPFLSLSGAPQQTTPASPQHSLTIVQDEPAKQVNPAILGLAQNDDLNVATIARQAKEMTSEDGEVVISLH